MYKALNISRVFRVRAPNWFSEIGFLKVDEEVECFLLFHLLLRFLLLLIFDAMLQSIVVVVVFA